jgi:hypothetical protein
VKEESQHKLGRYLTSKGLHADTAGGGRVKRIGIGLRLPECEDCDLSSEKPYEEASIGNSLTKSLYKN